MSTAAAELPTDVATLQAMVPAHAAELAQSRTARQLLDGELASARGGLVEQRFEIEPLKSRRAKLLRCVWAASEKLRHRTSNWNSRWPTSTSCRVLPVVDDFTR